MIDPETRVKQTSEEVKYIAELSAKTERSLHMGRNKLMRAGSIVAVAAVVSTSAVSGTFAKYVSEGSGSDSARVAKWGVKVTASGTTFAKTYTTDADPKPKQEAEEIEYSVVAETVSGKEDNVVAPGTKGELAAVTITGKPEVAVEVKFAPIKEDGQIFSIGDNWKYNSGAESETDSYYCPLKIKVGNTTYFGMDYDNADAFESAVNTAIAGYTKNYKAGTDLSATTAVAPSISWSWDFEGTGADPKQTDAKDTYLGNLTADIDATNDPTVELNLKVTVTQID